jgi:hypothetical protein
MHPTNSDDMQYAKLLIGCFKSAEDISDFMPNNKLFANALDAGFVNAWSNFAVKYCLVSMTHCAETISLKNEFEAWYCATVAPQISKTHCWS